MNMPTIIYNSSYNTLIFIQWCLTQYRYTSVVLTWCSIIFIINSSLPYKWYSFNLHTTELVVIFSSELLCQLQVNTGTVECHICHNTLAKRNLSTQLRFCNYLLDSWHIDIHYGSYKHKTVVPFDLPRQNTLNVQTHN